MQNFKDWVIVANGKSTSKLLNKETLKNKKVLALDGGALLCLKWKISPDVVLGDFDSIDLSVLHASPLFKNTLFIPAPYQNQTDLEKGLAYLNTLKSSSIEIFCATGSRSDHSLHAHILLHRYYEAQRPIILHTEKEKIFFVKDQTLLLDGPRDSGVAILGFPQATLSSTGLQYDMDNLNIQWLESSSICNTLIHPQGTLIIKGEALVILEDTLMHKTSNFSDP